MPACGQWCIWRPTSLQRLAMPDSSWMFWALCTMLLALRGRCMQGESNERNWNMLYGLDVCLSRNLVIAGDTRGAMHFCDPRDGGSPGAVLAHKKGNKVRPCGQAAHPMEEIMCIPGAVLAHKKGNKVCHRGQAAHSKEMSCTICQRQGVQLLLQPVPESNS